MYALNAARKIGVSLEPLKFTEPREHKKLQLNLTSASSCNGKGRHDGQKVHHGKLEIFRRGHPGPSAVSRAHVPSERTVGHCKREYPPKTSLCLGHESLLLCAIVATQWSSLLLDAFAIRTCHIVKRSKPSHTSRENKSPILSQLILRQTCAGEMDQPLVCRRK